MTVAYLAAEGYEQQLLDELRLALVPVDRCHGRLFFSNECIEAAWSLNTWLDVEYIEIESISDAASVLRQRQRSWAAYLPEHRGRGALVPVQPDVQRVRGHPRRADAGGPGVGLRWLRRGPRPRPQRGDQPERPRGEFRRDSLWSGRLWPWPRGQGETSRDEAGT